mmetsp:Transcript_575/g.1099  ORF Transcript_575/g.1099 Transcript_575/m.1099 type:complete len:363 (-) Transcript_575:5638-6726(-)
MMAQMVHSMVRLQKVQIQKFRKANQMKCQHILKVSNPTRVLIHLGKRPAKKSRKANQVKSQSLQTKNRIECLFMKELSPFRATATTLATSTGALICLRVDRQKKVQNAHRVKSPKILTKNAIECLLMKETSTSLAIVTALITQNRTLIRPIHLKKLTQKKINKTRLMSFSREQFLTTRLSPSLAKAEAQMSWIQKRNRKVESQISQTAKNSRDPMMKRVNASQPTGAPLKRSSEVMFCVEIVIDQMKTQKLPDEATFSTTARTVASRSTTTRSRRKRGEDTVAKFPVSPGTVTLVWLRKTEPLETIAPRTATLYTMMNQVAQRKVNKKVAKKLKDANLTTRPTVWRMKTAGVTWTANIYFPI